MPRPSSGRLIVEVANRRIPYWTPGYNNFADVREVARGMIAAWLHGKRGERYILGGEELTYRDYMERVARVAGVDPPRRRLPYPVAWIGGKAGDLLRGRHPSGNHGQLDLRPVRLHRPLPVQQR